MGDCTKPYYTRTSKGVLRVQLVGDTILPKFESKPMQEIVKMKSAILHVDHCWKTGVRTVTCAPYYRWCVVVAGYICDMSQYGREFAMCFAYEGVVYRYCGGYKHRSKKHPYPIIPFYDYKTISVLPPSRCTRKFNALQGVGPVISFVDWLMGIIEYSVHYTKIDEQYCAGEVNMSVDVKKFTPPVTTRDPVVQQRFSEIMNVTKNGRDGFSGRPTVRMRGIEWWQRCAIYDAWVERRHVDWRDISGDFYYGVKAASVKKDGSRRLVFPMSPKINAYLTQTFGEQRPKYPSNVEIVKDFRKFDSRCRYSYDVKSCDKVAYPYLIEAVRSVEPRAVQKIFNKCVYNGSEFELPQIPSGMAIFMGHYASAFSCAIANLAEHPGIIQVQGDGIITSIPLEGECLKYLHKEKDYIINGFDVRDHSFVNGDEKLSTPILRIPGRMYGEEKWCFRRCIYETLLKGTVTLPHKNRDLYDKFCAFTVRELMDYAFKWDEDTYALLGRTFCSRNNFERTCGYDFYGTQGYMR